MSTAGYSNKTLVQKLGIKEGLTIAIVNPPSGYHHVLGKLPPLVVRYRKLERSVDLIHYFTKETSELSDMFPNLKKSLVHDGALWISWPKKSSQVPTDLNENIVREIGLKNGLVDVKICAVDEVWSGLKFVFRKKDRKQ
ncbi:MAG: DUF3052 family protein [Ignavibacteriae bacterium]|nr:DUF3052 family protein [Ignavibacteria bacterium]MBI3364186.1 DUF3052 family protein [Ignavibacteriota bacterium]